MSKSQTSFRRRLLRAGIATATTVAAVSTAVTPAYAATVAVTLNTTSASAGSVTSGVNVVASASTAWLTASNNSTAPAKAILSTSASCGNNYPSSVASGLGPSTVSKYSDTRGSFSIPDPAPTATTTYRVCIYTGTTTSDTLIGNSAFTIYANPGVGSAVIDVATGPTSGGTRVVVTLATGLPTTAAGYSSITVGGTAATSISAVSATSVAFTTAASAPNATASIVINLAAGGTATLTPTFNYYNAITVTPSSGTFATDTPVYITGGGFTTWLSGRTFTYTAGGDFAGIFLMQGAYGVNGGQTAYSPAPTTECTGVVVLSDTEIICNLMIGSTATSTTNLALVSGTDTPRGAYTLTIVKDIQYAATISATAITPSATFTVSSYV